jgi:hypothetical protein
MAADPVTRGREARLLADMLQALNTLPKPLIGRVQGQCVRRRGRPDLGLRCCDRREPMAPALG